jgi:hypothetical protein
MQRFPRRYVAPNVLHRTETKSQKMLTAESYASLRSACLHSYMQMAIHMASTKSVKTAERMKTSRKNPAVVTSKSAPVSGHAGEIKAEISIKKAAGTICAVISLPPPTGQPLKPPGKSPRIATAPHPHTSRWKNAKQARGSVNTHICLARSLSDLGNRSEAGRGQILRAFALRRNACLPRFTMFKRIVVLFAQESGEIRPEGSPLGGCTGQVILQPILPKSDRLLEGAAITQSLSGASRLAIRS